MENNPIHGVLEKATARRRFPNIILIKSLIVFQQSWLEEEEAAVAAVATTTTTRDVAAAGDVEASREREPLRLG